MNSFFIFFYFAEHTDYVDLWVSPGKTCGFAPGVTCKYFTLSVVPATRLVAVSAAVPGVTGHGRPSAGPNRSPA